MYFAFVILMLFLKTRQITYGSEILHAKHHSQFSLALQHAYNITHTLEEVHPIDKYTIICYFNSRKCINSLQSHNFINTSSL